MKARALAQPPSKRNSKTALLLLVLVTLPLFGVHDDSEWERMVSEMKKRGAKMEEKGEAQRAGGAERLVSRVQGMSSGQAA